MTTHVFVGCSNPNCAREFVADFKFYDKHEIQYPFCSNCDSIIERVIVEVASC